VGAHASSNYTRLQVPSNGLNWISVVRVWNPGESWHGANFLVTPLIAKPKLIIDIFATGRLPNAAAYQIAQRMAEYNVTSWSEKDPALARMVWRSVALFGLRVLSDCLLDSVAPVLEPTPAQPPRVGYAVLASQQQACAKLQEFLNVVLDQDRQRELAGLLEVVQRRSFAQDSYCLIFLAPIRLVNRVTQCTVKELDGLWAEIAPASIRWGVMEHKSGKQSGACGQLAGVAEFLRCEVSVPLQERMTSGKAAVVVFEFVEPAAESRSAALVQPQTTTDD